MIHSIYPISDVTLYEYHSVKNTGLDEILDLSKLINSSSIYNNRILVKFDLTSISQSLVNNTITNPKFYINLYSADVREVPYSYTIEAFPISQSWEPGVGKFINYPETQFGASWKNRTNTSANSLPWTTSSFAVGSTGSYTVNPGGGTWYINYGCSQSYNVTNADIRMDVTSIVTDWLNNTIPNNGFLIKKSVTNEVSTENFETLQFFSSDSQTVYTPKLEVAWDNAVYVTGSLTQPNSEKDIILYMPNLKKEYSELSKARFNLRVREKYPTITFATQSNYLTVNYLPTSSLHYSIRYADTNEVVIPFDDTYTKVSCTSSGNFFDVWLDSLYAEKYYKFVFRVERNQSTEYYDNNYIFKIIK